MPKFIKNMRPTNKAFSIGLLCLLIYGILILSNLSGVFWTVVKILLYVTAAVAIVHSARLDEREKWQKAAKLHLDQETAALDRLWTSVALHAEQAHGVSVAMSKNFTFADYREIPDSLLTPEQQNLKTLQQEKERLNQDFYAVNGRREENPLPWVTAQTKQGVMVQGYLDHHSAADKEGFVTVDLASRNIRSDTTYTAEVHLDSITEGAPQ